MTPEESLEHFKQLGRQLLFGIKVGIGVLYTSLGAVSLGVGIKILRSLNGERDTQ